MRHTMFKASISAMSGRTVLTASIHRPLLLAVPVKASLAGNADGREDDPDQGWRIVLKLLHGWTISQRRRVTPPRIGMRTIWRVGEYYACWDEGLRQWVWSPSRLHIMCAVAKLDVGEVNPALPAAANRIGCKEFDKGWSAAIFSEAALHKLIMHSGKPQTKPPPRQVKQGRSPGYP